MHAVIRRYTGAAALIDALDQRQPEVEQVIAGAPGFLAYHAIRMSDDALVTVSICRDRAGTAETTRRAAEWVRANVPAGSVGSPDVAEGEAFVNFAAPQSVGQGAVRA